jgi:hypothetical protein
MGNRKIRDLMLQKERDEHWQHIRKTPRAATREVFAQGIGQLRMQLIVCPSFEEGRAWEVRSQLGLWKLFEPRIVQQSGLDVQLIGYDSVPFPLNQLAGYFDRVTALSLPIAPDLSGCSGCDGTMYQMAVFGDMFSSWRFHWWSSAPKTWQPLIAIAEEMIAAFRATER